jgi:anti-sigma28 factor (negative regulator of flagellin synthesis)
MKRLKELKKSSGKIKKFSPKYGANSSVIIRIFGGNTSNQYQSNHQKEEKQNKTAKSKDQTTNRQIASVKKKVEVKKSDFDGSLLKQYKQQLRHSDDLNRLIDDLRSFEMDYKKDY